jgi:hypothetical protein
MIFTGPGVVTTSVAIVGERPDRAHIVVQPYPSDHRAVVAAVELRDPPAKDQAEHKRLPN